MTEFEKKLTEELADMLAENYDSIGGYSVGGNFSKKGNFYIILKGDNDGKIMQLVLKEVTIVVSEG